MSVGLTTPFTHDSEEARLLKADFARTLAGVVAAAGGTVTVAAQHKEEANGACLIVTHGDEQTIYSLNKVAP